MKFSCIIPSLARKTLYELTLPSIFSQNRKFDEVIVMYDLPRSGVVSQSPQGVTASFTGGNKGAAATLVEAYARSSGDYVVLLDDDDVLHTDFLQGMSDFIEFSVEKPALIIPRVRKVWPEGFLPSYWVSPPLSRRDDLIFDNCYRPITCSGLTVNKQRIEHLPLNPLIKGFSDIQIYENITKMSMPITYNASSEVTFNQFFSLIRNTSDLSSRKKNIEMAKMNGMSFSDAQLKIMLISVIISNARSEAYRTGLLASLQELWKNFRNEKIHLREVGYQKLFINIIFILWIGVSRRFLSKNE